MCHQKVRVTSQVITCSVCFSVVKKIIHCNCVSADFTRVNNHVRNNYALPPTGKHRIHPCSNWQFNISGKFFTKQNKKQPEKQLEDFEG